MTDENCHAMQLLVQADADNELSAAEAAGVHAHLEHCAACTQVQAGIMALSDRLRQEAPFYHASAALREKVQVRITSLTATPHLPAASPSSSMRRRFGWRSALPFAGGFALAACLALLLLLPRTGNMLDAVVSGHVRALQPGHLMDVVSTDQHTVKPWFDGRLDYAPPVKDLARGGFPLEGGRLDVLDGKPVAALVYGRRQHSIDVYVIPGTGRAHAEGSINGYNYIQWSEGGMVFWAVSNVGATDLSEFVRLWRAG